MYFIEHSLFPENMQPLIITAAPYGPEWLPRDVEGLPLSGPSCLPASRFLHWASRKCDIHADVRVRPVSSGTISLSSNTRTVQSTESKE
jgi:hypothetical protein